MLSILIPNYNHCRFLPEILDQVYKQSLEPEEIIVIDDASTDDSVEFIERHYPKVKLIRNQINVGVVKNVNRGTKMASGKYIIYLAADDWIFPGFFEESVRALEKHPSAGLSTGKMAFFSEETPPYQFQYFEVDMAKEGYYSSTSLQKLMDSSPFFIYTTASCYRREGMAIQNGNYGYIADWDMNMKIAFEKGIVYLPHLFGACRLLKRSYAATSRKNSSLRNQIFEDLILDLSKRGEVWDKAMQKGGLLSHLGIKMVQYLARNPRYWRYLPATFMKKWQFYLNSRKLKQR